MQSSHFEYFYNLVSNLKNRLHYCPGKRMEWQLIVNKGDQVI